MLWVQNKVWVDQIKVWGPSKAYIMQIREIKVG
jgi:hypothetical protein